MARQALVILAVVVAFGILVPIYKGFGFLDPRIIAAYAFLALLFVAPASAELAATHGKEAPAFAILGRIAIIVAWGWGITVLILATAIVTLNVMARRGGFLTPPLDFIAAVLAFSLSAAIAIAMLGAMLARRFSASQVKNILRAAFLIILLALVFAPRVLPENVTLVIFSRFSTRRALTHLAWEASAVFGAIAILLLPAIFQGSRKTSAA
jgi:hypothetical protein